MKNKDVEIMLKNSCKNIVPDVFENIKASNTEIFPDENQTLNKSKIKKVRYNLNIKKISFALCFIILIMISSFGSMIYAEAEDSSIYIDINPSVEIITNNANEVKDVKILNDDGELMLYNLNLKGQDLDDAINIIIEKAIDYGYVKAENISNEILISVSNNNKNKQNKVLNQVYENINRKLASKGISNRNITKQNITKEEKEKADKLEISAGKLVLINKIIALNSSYTIKDLENKSVKELKEIYKKLIEEHYQNTDDYDKDSNSKKYEDDYSNYFDEDLGDYIQQKRKGN
jgi:hypothetical protein